MAFSLLNHLQTTRQTELEALLPNADQASQRELLALVLGQLIVRDRADSSAVYQAIKQQNHDEFWQGLDLNTLQPLAQQHGLSTEALHQVIDQLYAYTANEINSLDDAANLEQAGVSELIQGQADYLAGQADAQIWTAINLPELQGAAPVQEQAVDLNASIASLSKMMHDASQRSQQPAPVKDEHMNHNASTADLLTKHPAHDLHAQDSEYEPNHADDHNVDHNPNHNHIELVPQRPAPRFFLALEPLIALAILAAVWIGYLNISSYY